MPTHTRAPRAAVLTLLRLLPQDRWINPATIARAAARAGITVTADPTTRGEYLIDDDRLASLLNTLRRAGWARTRSDGTWVRTPTGTIALGGPDAS